ncbi:hypothetical protein [Aquirufa nivalisilvae]|uniref:hypothetical protein n=1 Tax=Aquirufa TaxID=2676247 RepID=UPI0022A98CFD|nr:hypothetical protein [Aquirufa nivalisilvae]MCZ2480018.1 hypothetical protein [Aquirufa nivalisilvae]
MAANQSANVRRDKIKQARLEVVAKFYKRGYTYEQIIEELAKKEPSLKCSKATIHKDVHLLLKEWQKERISDIDPLIQLELQRIDDACKVLWKAWDKSCEDHKLSSSKVNFVQNGSDDSADSNANSTSKRKIKSMSKEKTEKEQINFGDPRYISEIRAQLIERRKLLGLYAPEKREFTGKDGMPLNPAVTDLDVSKLSDEDFANILLIARKVERQS